MKSFAMFLLFVSSTFSSLAATPSASPLPRLELANISLGATWKEAVSAAKLENVKCKVHTSMEEPETECSFSLPKNATWLGLRLSREGGIALVTGGKVVFAYVELEAVERDHQEAANVVTDRALQALAARRHMTAKTERYIETLSSVNLDDVKEGTPAMKAALATDALWAKIYDNDKLGIAIGSAEMMKEATRVGRW